MAFPDDQSVPVQLLMALLVATIPLWFALFYGGWGFAFVLSGAVLLGSLTRIRRNTHARRNAQPHA